MDELKLIIASNLIKLRNDAGMTQAELGRLLNYSDKTISKWERAESMPDVASLKKMSEIYSVSMDFLVTEHDAWEHAGRKTRARLYSNGIIRFVLATILGIAVLVFAVLWMCGIFYPQTLAYALLICLIALLAMNTLWRDGKNNLYIVFVFVLCLISCVYLLSYKQNLWQIFLLIIPAELIVYFSFHLKKH